MNVAESQASAAESQDLVYLLLSTDTIINLCVTLGIGQIFYINISIHLN